MFWLVLMKRSEINKILWNHRLETMNHRIIFHRTGQELLWYLTLDQSFWWTCVARWQHKNIRLRISIVNPFLLITWFLWQQHPEAVPEVAEERKVMLYYLWQKTPAFTVNQLKVIFFLHHFYSSVCQPWELLTANYLFSKINEMYAFELFCFTLLN